MADSIIQKEKCCYVCGTTKNLQEHHIFGGASRKLSERDGLKVWLCLNHHTGPQGVHFNPELMDLLHRKGQLAYEAKIGTREEFMDSRNYGKSYL